MQKYSESEVFKVLQTVMDPEIPVISVLEMGIIRQVRWDEGASVLHVDITPTYSGCPAMEVIEQDVTAALVKAGFKNVEAHRIYSPAWTTDWLSTEGKEKLRRYGIAPPIGDAQSLVKIGARAPDEVVPCPFCESARTELRSQFGATACKAFYFCNECRQPFEYFKPI